MSFARKVRRSSADTLHQRYMRGMVKRATRKVEASDVVHFDQPVEIDPDNPKAIEVLGEAVCAEIRKFRGEGRTGSVRIKSIDKAAGVIVGERPK